MRLSSAPMTGMIAQRISGCSANDRFLRQRSLSTASIDRSDARAGLIHMPGPRALTPLVNGLMMPGIGRSLRAIYFLVMIGHTCNDC
jgi:hypothetical protein